MRRYVEDGKVRYQVGFDSSWRLVIPKEFRDEVGLTPGTRAEIKLEDGLIRLVPKLRTRKNKGKQP